MTTKKSKINNKFCYGIIISLLLVGIFLCPVSALASDITPNKVIELTNQERSQKDLGRVTTDPNLTQAAKEKAQFLLEKQTFEHNPGDRKFSDWIKDTDYQYSYVGENLAMDFTESEDIVRAWMGSPNHKKNILYPEYRDIGVAVTQGQFQGHDSVLVVQIFGTPATTTEATASSDTQTPTINSSGAELSENKTAGEVAGNTTSQNNGLKQKIAFIAQDDPFSTGKTALLIITLALILTHLYTAESTRLTKKRNIS